MRPRRNPNNFTATLHPLEQPKSRKGWKDRRSEFNKRAAEKVFKNVVRRQKNWT